jgi:hypothetical protein
LPVTWDFAGYPAYSYRYPTLRADPVGLWVAGLGGGIEAQFIGVGFQFYAYFVWDDDGGFGMLFSPAFRTGIAIALGLNPAGFVNFQADTIRDVEGWGGEIGLELVVFSVAAQASLSRKPNRTADLLWGFGAGGFGLGFGIGLYVAVGYSVLWEWRAPRVSGEGC